MFSHLSAAPGGFPVFQQGSVHLRGLSPSSSLSAMAGCPLVVPGMAQNAGQLSQLIPDSLFAGQLVPFGLWSPSQFHFSSMTVDGFNFNPSDMKVNEDHHSGMETDHLWNHQPRLHCYTICCSLVMLVPTLVFMDRLHRFSLGNVSCCRWNPSIVGPQCKKLLPYPATFYGETWNIKHLSEVGGYPVSMSIVLSWKMIYTIPSDRDQTPL